MVTTNRTARWSHAALVATAAAALACAAPLFLKSGGPGINPAGLFPAVEAKPASQPDFGKMAVTFIKNEGQLPSEVGYYVQGQDKALYFTREGITFSLTDRKSTEHRTPNTGYRSWATKLIFIGANRDARLIGREKQQGIVSYFTGAEKDWKSGIPTYSELVYENLWDGIDLVYSGTVDKLKYSFHVRPGADPSQIKLRYDGADVSVNAKGQLEVRTPVASFEDDTPVSFQQIDGRQVEVKTAYDLQGKTFAFNLGEYDSSKELIIDPAVIVYCGFLGSTGVAQTYGRGIATDSAGNVYICGNTTSGTAFPTVVGPKLAASYSVETFVAKLNSSGTGFAYCGFIGGFLNDYCDAIAVDGTGSAYVMGRTNSTPTYGFPVLNGPKLTLTGGEDAYVARITPSGDRLLFCGYVGGAGNEKAIGIAADASGCYIAGETVSDASSFPVKVGPKLVRGSTGLVPDVFVAKVTNAGQLVYCGYIGGTGQELGGGIAVDSSGNAYVVGQTTSGDGSFPVVGGPARTPPGTVNGFISKVNATGSAFVYSGFIGGSNGATFAYDVAVDLTGSAFVTGYTTATQASFPVKGGPDLTANGGMDAFVAKLKPAPTDATPLNNYIYCGFLGGSSSDCAYRIAIDGNGAAAVSGYTLSSGATFPIVGGPSAIFKGGADGFVAKVKPSPTSTTVAANYDFSGYLGGAGYDYANDVAVSGAGDVFVVGATTSDQASFPVLIGPDLTKNSSSGYNDCFVAKINFSLTALSAYTVSTSSSSVQRGGSITVSWTNPNPSSRWDWVGMFRVGAANEQYLAYQYIGDQRFGSGRAAFTAPSTTGQIEFRYFLDNGFTEMARSGAVNVQ